MLRGMPKGAAGALKLKFSGVDICHSSTLQQAGLCNQAQFSVHGEKEATKLVALAQGVIILRADPRPPIHGYPIEYFANDWCMAVSPDVLHAVCTIYPDQINAKQQTGSFETKDRLGVCFA